MTQDTDRHDTFNLKTLEPYLQSCIKSGLNASQRHSALAYMPVLILGACETEIKNGIIRKVIGTNYSQSEAFIAESLRRWGICIATLRRILKLFDMSCYDAFQGR